MRHCAVHMFINGHCVDCGRSTYEVSQSDMAREFGRPAREGHHFVRNLMSREVNEIADDTPFCCNPSTETFWSM